MISAGNSLSAALLLKGVVPPVAKNVPGKSYPTEIRLVGRKGLTGDVERSGVETSGMTGDDDFFGTAQRIET
jgi:hypothetical protein